MYLHGGPGYNSYAFEKSVGALLAPQLRMVYLDQRGSGRSQFDGHQEKLGINPTIEDVERLRKHLGVARLSLIGHSFGALVALEYVKTYPDHVGSVILVDGLADIASALSHQIATLAQFGPTAFPKNAAKLKALSESSSPPFQKIEAAYSLLGRLALQRQLHYATSAGQNRNERWDEESGLRACDSSSVVERYIKDHYVDSPHSELMKPLTVPGIIFAGRRSNVIGPTNIEAASRALNIPVRWFENSGHFIYVEEPKEFADGACEFILRGS